MAILAAQHPAATGVALTRAAAGVAGDSFQNSGVESVQLTNAHATLPRTVTFDSPGACSFGLSANAAHDAVVVVPALTTMVIGTFAVGRFNDVNGRVQITYSDAAADLTVAIVAP